MRSRVSGISIHLLFFTREPPTSIRCLIYRLSVVKKFPKACQRTCPCNTCRICHKLPLLPSLDTNILHSLLNNQYNCNIDLILPQLLIAFCVFIFSLMVLVLHISWSNGVYKIYDKRKIAWEYLQGINFSTINPSETTNQINTNM